MNKYFESASERYPEILAESLITPISKVDGEIIAEIFRLVENVPVLRTILPILNEWKYQKDQDILTLLKGVPNISYTHTFFIRIGSVEMDISDIKNIESGEEYNFVKNKILYYIIINRLPETTEVRNIYTNKMVEYEDETARDSDLKQIREIMKKFGVEFLN